MNALFSISILILIGSGLGVVAGRDLARMAAGFSGSGIRGAVAWGLGKRLALFLLVLALGTPQGPAGILAAAAGYLAGFTVMAFRQRVSLGR